MAVPRQSLDVHFLLVGFADHLSRGVDKHCHRQRQRERPDRQRLHHLLHDPAHRGSTHQQHHHSHLRLQSAGWNALSRVDKTDPPDADSDIGKRHRIQDVEHDCPYPDLDRACASFQAGFCFCFDKRDPALDPCHPARIHDQLPVIGHDRSPSLLDHACIFHPRDLLRDDPTVRRAVRSTPAHAPGDTEHRKVFAFPVVHVPPHSDRTREVNNG